MLLKMISVLKRLTKKREEQPVFPMGVAAMGKAMQKKFAHGIQYNMKIIIRGDRNTGKTCLFHRLQGQPFIEGYLPTYEIQVTSINWDYRGAEDVVKVEVWDVVDKGQKKKSHKDNLKITNIDNDESVDSNIALDAEFLDVYKGTHGVIMLMDITKPWTWTYVERELPKIPNHLPVLVLANFQDMHEHRLIDVDHMVAFVENIDRPCGSAEVNFCESSMKDGFGLKYIYRFLNMPFLILQRETLLKQLEVNALEIDETSELLERNPETDEQNHDLFIQSMEQRKIKTSGTVSPSSDTEENGSEAIKQPDDANGDREQPVAKVSPISSRQSTPKKSKESPMPSCDETDREQEEEESHINEVTTDVISSPKSTGDIHEFNPSEKLDPSFLGGGKAKFKWFKKETKTETTKPLNSSDEESDDDGVNPLVAGFQDLESDEDSPISKSPPTLQIQVPDQINSDVSSEDEIQNPVVTQPVNNDSFDDEDCDTKQSSEASNPSIEETVSSIAKQTFDLSITSKSTVDKNIKKQESLVESSDEEEDKDSNKYTVTADFDFDDPSVDDWLNSDDDTQKTTKKGSNGKKNEETERTKKRSTASLIIATDELDMFMADQMRKTSISEEDDKTKKIKKKKDKTEGQDGETKKKKKKNKKVKEIVDSEEKEVRKKKKVSKNKDVKKKRTENLTADAAGNADYELL